MTSRFPLTVTLSKDGQEWKSVAPFVDFDAARNYICDQLKTGVADKGVMSAMEPDATENFMELHYRGFDDPQRGRIVIGGLDDAQEADENMETLKKQYAERRVFSPRELFELKPIQRYKVGWLGGLEKYLREDGIDIDYQAWEKIEAEGRIKFDILVSEDMGSDELLEIATVRFQIGSGIFPVAVVTHAGEDDGMRYVVDRDTFSRMLVYLRTFMETPEDEPPYVTDFDTPLSALTEFNGYDLYDWYDVEKQERKETNPHSRVR